MSRLTRWSGRYLCGRLQRSYGTAVEPPQLSAMRLMPFQNCHLLAQARADALLMEPCMNARDPDMSPSYIQEHLRNFYAPETQQPYVPLAARGPWVLPASGGVVYDCGGYGMLGWGHNPSELLGAMGRPQVMTFAMTANPTLRRFTDALLAEIGHTRSTSPLTKFMFVNSGSEAMGLACRITDARVRAVADASASRPRPRVPLRICLQGSFHGRAAQISDSSRETYEASLASFAAPERRDDVLRVPANDVPALRRAFDHVVESKRPLESLTLEPTMGEGRQGLAITPEFYDCARRGTVDLNSVLVVDSVQAGMRATGTLSVLDAPGFSHVDPCDIEIYSKAISGGQFPLSVVALGDRVHDAYHPGTYGNTMTGNPCAMDVGTASLRLLTPDVRRNIRDMGHSLRHKLADLHLRYPQIWGVSGNGLLLAVHLDPAIPVVCRDGVVGLERVCRDHGLNVVHGGKNSIRLTPHFRITDAEVDLIVHVIEDALLASSQRRRMRYGRCARFTG